MMKEIISSSDRSVLGAGFLGGSVICDDFLDFRCGPRRRYCFDASLIVAAAA
jgi:hypothetical protein